MLVNRDENNPHTVRVVFDESGKSASFSGPVTLVTFGSEQYVWINDGPNSHADPDNPPVATSVAAEPEPHSRCPRRRSQCCGAKCRESESSLANHVGQMPWSVPSDEALPVLPWLCLANSGAALRRAGEGTRPYVVLAESVSVTAIGHEAVGFGAQTIHRRRRRDVERAVVLVSPGQVGRLLRHLDRAQMVALRVPHPDTFGPGHKQISIVVNFDSVGDAFVRSAGFLAEDPAIAQRTIGGDVVDANISLFTVIDVEVFSVGRKSQAVGLGQVFGQKADARPCRRGDTHPERVFPVSRP